MTPSEAARDHLERAYAATCNGNLAEAVAQLEMALYGSGFVPHKAGLLMLAPSRLEIQDAVDEDDFDRLERLEESYDLWSAAERARIAVIQKRFADASATIESVLWPDGLPGYIKAVQKHCKRAA